MKIHENAVHDDGVIIIDVVVLELLMILFWFC